MNKIKELVPLTFSVILGMLSLNSDLCNFEALCGLKLPYLISLLQYMTKVFDLWKNYIVSVLGHYCVIRKYFKDQNFKKICFHYTWFMSTCSLRGCVSISWHEYSTTKSPVKPPGTPTAFISGALLKRKHASSVLIREQQRKSEQFVCKRTFLTPIILLITTLSFLSLVPSLTEYFVLLIGNNVNYIKNMHHF